MSNTTNYFNKETIIKVSVHLTVKSDDYYFHPGTKFLGITLKKEGFYGVYFNNFKGTEPPNGTHRMGLVVFQNPYVTLHYADGHSFTKRFESDGDARKYSHQVMKGGPFTQSGL